MKNQLKSIQEEKFITMKQHLPMTTSISDLGYDNLCLVFSHLSSGQLHILRFVNHTIHDYVHFFHMEKFDKEEHDEINNCLNFDDEDKDGYESESESESESDDAEEEEDDKSVSFHRCNRRFSKSNYKFLTKFLCDESIANVFMLESDNVDGLEWFFSMGFDCKIRNIQEVVRRKRFNVINWILKNNKDENYRTCIEHDDVEIQLTQYKLL